MLLSWASSELGAWLHSTSANWGEISSIYKRAAFPACSCGFKRTIPKIQLGCGECWRFGQAANRAHRKSNNQIGLRSILIHFPVHKGLNNHNTRTMGGGGDPLGGTYSTYTPVLCLSPHSPAINILVQSSLDATPLARLSHPFQN